ncbi:protein of unknown function [Pseudodesulfovibrio profundus]|uniref:Uncharacterized protein n=1 Tax=Pseudodesulfovibrio profundus TaxID=57320 RepID=A0A2C8F7F2_9BACT|nr:protein of unknown function [Pseudodesulfovibrio profundus]
MRAHELEYLLDINLDAVIFEPGITEDYPERFTLCQLLAEIFGDFSILGETSGKGIPIHEEDLVAFDGLSADRQG